MRKISLFISISILTLTVFGVGAATAVFLHWGRPIATIYVQNEFDKKIESITITYTTCGLKRSLIYKSAEQHQFDTDSKRFSMQVVLCGEGSHITEIALSNGQIFTSKGFYIQGGDEVTERITESGISSAYTRTLP